MKLCPWFKAFCHASPILVGEGTARLRLGGSGATNMSFLRLPIIPVHCY